MYITELRIRHYRNFMKSKFVFSEGVNTLIGENGSGKTNALYALRLLLDETLSRNSVYLRETEFCRGLGNWRGHWIILAADFADLDASEGCQLLRHNTAHMNGTQRGTYSFIYRPKLEVRKRLHELSGNRIELADYLKTITLDNYEFIWTGRASGDFLDDGVYNSFAGDHGAGIFPDPDNDDLGQLGVKIQPIYQEIACTFVPALRDVVSELHGYRGNPLLTILRGTETTIHIADSERIIGKVADLNDDISSLAEIKNLSQGIETTLHNAVGHTFAPGVSIVSALPNSMEKILQRLNVLVGDDSESSHRGELFEQSLGGANLIFLALKLLEYEIKLSTDRVAHFLLIEEPEAHIHTHIQKSLFSNLPSDRTQVIVSTHSTHISSASLIATVNVLAKKATNAEVYQPANGLDSDAIKRAERYLDAVRSTLLFAKGVLLVEGDAEQIMIPALVKSVLGVTTDEMGFSVISMSSSFFEHVAVIFSDARIMRPCAIITDYDSAFIDLPENQDDDNKEQAHARAAAEKGAARRVSLDRFITGNDWIKAFYAENTFEVEFLKVENVWEVEQILGTIYTRATDIARCEAALRNADIKVSGKEVLRLAEKEGKGWFALLLSEKLCSQTNIPEYILRAIAFACHSSIDERVLKQMGLHRIQNEGLDEPLIAGLPGIEELLTLAPREFISLYRRTAPEDILTLFCQYIEEYRMV